ncbi:transcriptional regulatory protein YehT [Kordia sp. SMS9]|uniref:LytR/AlgR family response regulator transcription factor n=1 Tax=Kordia sp. SMS9 TaxID=2282170 RepID=UPI000E0D61A7|nr:LytTR family DNA-binding domain-containing protein [Kordia sp. SMS9]AXG70787.1 transcriptional regulatory protein YehT [Kordia sp. SMS9]
MKIKTLIIDDEIAIRNDLKTLLQEHFSETVSVIGEASNVAEGIAQIKTLKPDVILLDIHLGDGTGFEILAEIPNKDFNIIFVTGFDNNAIKAIKVGALDYILKPVDEDEFVIAIEKAIALKNEGNHLDKLIEVSQDFFEGVKEKRVILKTSDAVYAVYEKDILYCRSEGNYTTFYTQQLEKIMISKPMKKVEELLSPELFIRCHQSYIVNKKHVLKYDKNGVLIVHIDIKIPVSSRRKEYTLEKIFS